MLYISMKTNFGILHQLIEYRDLNVQSCSIGILYISIKTSTDWGLNVLVGGIPTPLKNMLVSWDYYSQYMEKTSCSKPPTRNKLCIFPRQVVVNHQKVRSWPTHGSAKHMKTWLVVDLPTIGW
jgi:hypothetical protein